MKVLVISSESPEISVGGIERHIKNFINYCRHRNKDVIFLLPTNKEESSERMGNVLVLKRSFLYFNYKRVFNRKEIAADEMKEKSMKFFHFLLDLFDKEEIDIVSAQNSYNGLPPAYSLILNMACFSRNIPLVLRAHSFAKTELQKSLAKDLFWERIICVSRSVAGDFFSKGADINKLNTHYLGVNIREFKPGANKHWLTDKLKIPENSKIILHASRIINGKRDVLKEKGILVLLEAFSHLALKNQGLTLLIAIAEPPRRLKEEFRQALDKLRGYIQLNNLEGRVICREFKLEEMPFVYNGADIFVLASENETFGQVYIEAMACGTPVIGTNVGGIPEIIADSYNGVLIQPNNPSLLAQKIEEILYNESVRKEFIKNGLKTARRKFSAERQFGLLFNYFKKIADSKRRD